MDPEIFYEEIGYLSLEDFKIKSHQLDEVDKLVSEIVREGITSAKFSGLLAVKIGRYQGFLSEERAIKALSKYGNAIKCSRDEDERGIDIKFNYKQRLYKIQIKSSSSEAKRFKRKMRQKHIKDIFVLVVTHNMTDNEIWLQLEKKLK